MRQGVTTHKWEVYAKLTNGSEFLFGINGTEPQAQELLQAVLHYALVQGQAFKLTTEGEYVNLFNIVRYYVDGEANDYVALLEDRSGASWVILRSAKRRECSALIKQVSNVVAILELEKKHDLTGPTSERPA